MKSFCLHRDGYSVVSFPKELCKAHLTEIREAGEQVVAELANHKSPQCIVDLTNLDYLGSSMVASIVRIWKTIDSNQGRMIVAASSNGVREVLRVTGLNKVWTIKPSYDHALHDLGFSAEAKIVKRELRLLAFVGPATLLVGGVAAALCRVPKLAALSQPHESVALALIGMAVVTSGVSVFRERSWRRWLSVIVFLCSSALLGYLIWTAPRATSSDEGKENTTIVKGSENGTSSETDKGESDTPAMDDPNDAEPTEQGKQDSPTTPPVVTGEGGLRKSRASSDTTKPAQTGENPAQSEPSETPKVPPAPDEGSNPTATPDPGNSDPAESGTDTSDKTRPAVEKP